MDKDYTFDENFNFDDYSEEYDVEDTDGQE
jgi:hypothetical protein